MERKSSLNKASNCKDKLKLIITFLAQLRIFKFSNLQFKFVIMCELLLEIELTWQQQQQHQPR